MCDQYFVAAYGSIEREYPFIACSDSKFTEVCLMVNNASTLLTDVG